MSDEHITTTTSPDGSVSHTTVSGGGSSSGWIMGLIAVILLGFGIYYFAMQSNSSANKDNAIAGAAQDAASNLKKN